MVHNKGDLIIIVMSTPSANYGENEGLKVQSFTSFSDAYGVGCNACVNMYLKK